MAIVRTLFNDTAWDKIEIANKSIKTIDVKGKPYAEVNQRVKAFRFVYPRGRIETKIISLDGEVHKRTVLMRCEVYDDLGNLLSTGYAEEKEDSTFINKTSFIENCETSCIGRALGQAGFGIDTSIASAEEVENAIANQDKKEDKPTQTKINQFYLLYSAEEIRDICSHYKVSNPEDLTRKLIDEYIKARKDKLADAKEKRNEEMKAKPLNDNGENPFY
jgi:hypothetical protein